MDDDQNKEIMFFSDSPENISDDEDIEDGCYEVHNILLCYKDPDAKQRLLYLVNWRFWDFDTSTWEFEDNLTCDKKIKEFKKVKKEIKYRLTDLDIQYISEGKVPQLEIEEIIKEKVDRDRLCFEVKWKGVPLTTLESEFYLRKNHENVFLDYIYSKGTLKRKRLDDVLEIRDKAREKKRRKIQSKTAKEKETKNLNEKDDDDKQIDISKYEIVHYIPLGFNEFKVQLKSKESNEEVYVSTTIFQSDKNYYEAMFNYRLIHEIGWKEDIPTIIIHKGKSGRKILVSKYCVFGILPNQKVIHSIYEPLELYCVLKINVREKLVYAQRLKQFFKVFDSLKDPDTDRVYLTGEKRFVKFKEIVRSGSIFFSDERIKYDDKIRKNFNFVCFNKYDENEKYFGNVDDEFILKSKKDFESISKEKGVGQIYKAVDLFAGAGLFSAGFESGSRVKVVFAVEKGKHEAGVFNLNFKNEEEKKIAFVGKSSVGNNVGIKTILIHANVIKKLQKKLENWDNEEHTISDFDDKGGMSIAISDKGVITFKSKDEKNRKVYSLDEVKKEYIEKTVQKFNKKYNKIFEEPIDIIIGGPPSKEDYRLNKKKNSRNTEKYGQLFTHYLEFVKLFRPKYFVIENVIELRDLERLFKSISKDIKEIGYQHKVVFLNSCHWGAPQSRWGVFIIGYDEKYAKELQINDNDIPLPIHSCKILGRGLRKDIKKSYKVDGEFQGGFGMKTVNTMWHAFSNISKDEEEVSRYDNKYQFDIKGENSELPYKVNDTSEYKDWSNVEEVNEMELGDDKKYNYSLRNKKDKRKVKKKVVKRMDMKFPTNALTTSVSWSGNSSVVHPYENRSINVREAARIMGVNDSFKFNYDKIEKPFMQLGNGVPTVLGKFISKILVKKLDEMNDRMED